MAKQLKTAMRAEQHKKLLIEARRQLHPAVKSLFPNSVGKRSSKEPMRDHKNKYTICVANCHRSVRPSGQVTIFISSDVSLENKHVFFVGFLAKNKYTIEELVAKSGLRPLDDRNQYETSGKNKYSYYKSFLAKIILGQRKPITSYGDNESYFGLYGHYSVKDTFNFDIELFMKFIQKCLPLSLRLEVDDAINDIGSDSPNVILNTGFRYLRDPEVRRRVKLRAAGKCEYCGEEGFLCEDGTRYLECHHVIALASDGKDRMSNVIALCPKHHREVHFAKHAKILDKQMRTKMSNIEKGND